MTLGALACFEQQPQSFPLLQELAMGSRPQLSCSPESAYVGEKKKVCCTSNLEKSKTKKLFS